MAGLSFNKNLLGNLEYSLCREMLSTNRAGGYMSTTIIGCNTRKYHGLMVCPVEELDNENYVLLSTIDKTVIQQEQSFNLMIHRFPGVYEPRGHKYIVDFSYTPVPSLTYRVGGVLLKVELVWIHSQQQLLMRYTLLDANSPTKVRIRPFLAFRNVHTLSKANMDANVYSYPIKNGIKNRLYDKFPWLHMQCNKENNFVAAPDWYYNFEYLEEKKRGYPYHEDLLTPGYFEFDIKKGESVTFSCSTTAIDPSGLEKQFNEEIAKRSEKIEFMPTLKHSARQFIVKQGNKTEVVAGYPWFGRWGRDTFIALPGITLTQGGVESCIDVINTMVSEMKDGLFPNMGTAYNSVDAPMWFFWALQQLEKHTSREKIWKDYGASMKAVLEAYRRGIGDAIKVDPNTMLVWAYSPQHALTWMDAIADIGPVTQRPGFDVEINALWYNAVSYTLALAEKFEDKEFIKSWNGARKVIQKSFNEMFWNPKEGYLADYVFEGKQNMDIRPNQIIAAAMPYNMLTSEQKQSIVNIIEKHLLTPRGLRTLSPSNVHYKGHYDGDQPTRDKAYHQGTVWPWLLEHYAKVKFDLLGKDFIQKAEELLEGFKEDFTTYGIGSIAEIFDGDPPHAPKGAISQAWSVAALLRINEMIEAYKKKK